MWKLSRPWHGPYCVVDRWDPDLTVVKVYSPQDGQIQIHQNRVAPCPPELPSAFFWYGTRRARPDRPPKWVNQLLQGDLFTDPEHAEQREDPEDAQLPDDSSTMEPEEDPVNAEDSPSPEDLPLENRDDDTADLTEEVLATDADSLSDVLNRDQLTSAKHDIDDSNSTQNSAQGPTPAQECPPPTKIKYSLRTKTSPPSRLMFVSSKTSCLRGGRDVKPS